MNAELFAISFDPQRYNGGGGGGGGTGCHPLKVFFFFNFDKTIDCKELKRSVAIS